MNLEQSSAAIRRSGSAGSPIIGFGVRLITRIIEITFIAILWSGILWPILANIGTALRILDSN